MPTLRQMIDGKVLAQASPAAEHVADHIQDPFGATKDSIDELNEAQLKYEMARAKMARGLAPVHQIVKGIDVQHKLGVTGDPAATQQNPDEALGMQTPQDGSADQIDPATGIPNNMGQTPGQMNQNRPSQAGFQPGVSPGPAESVRPSPLGRPQPGVGNVSQQAGFPSAQPGGTGKPQQEQYNPSAAKPKGAGQLPGAKGPGDPKVKKPIAKSQGKNGAGGNGRGIKVEVHADGSRSPAKTTLSAAMGVASLRSCDSRMKAAGTCAICGGKDGKHKADCSMKAYGTSEGVTKSWDTRGRAPQVGDKTNDRGGSGVIVKRPERDRTSPSYYPDKIYDARTQTLNRARGRVGDKTNDRGGSGVITPRPGKWRGENWN